MEKVIKENMVQLMKERIATCPPKLLERRRKSCKRCKKEFLVMPSRSRKMFCSKECSWANLQDNPKPCKKKNKFICPECKQIFYGYNNKKRGRSRVFCSRKCMGLGTRGPTIIVPWYKRWFNKIRGR